MSRKRVVAATDLSKKGDLVVNKAIDLTKKYDSWLEVIHVVSMPLFEMFFDEQYDKRTHDDSEKVKNKLKSISDTIKEKLHRGGEKINVEVKFGRAKDEIVHFSEAIRSDLIVIGSSGEYYPIEELVMGTTAKNIIDATEIPILIVKSDSDIESYKNITLLVDYSETSKKHIKFVSEFFADAKLTLVSVCELPSEFRLKYYGLEQREISSFVESEKNKYKQEFDAFVDDCGLDSSRVEKFIEYGSISATRFLDIAKSHEAGLVSVATSRMGGLISKIVGNTAAEIIDKSDIDVLAHHIK
ncbi:MAG: universal stress protein [Campylobacterales bacterium]